MKVALCIPILNPGKFAEEIVSSIRKQTKKPDTFWVIDSGSSDGSLEIFRKAGANTYQIKKQDFNHGGTRNLFIRLQEADVYLFLTQDSIPANSQAFEELLSIFDKNEKVGLAYGRQIPRLNAKPFETHARLFNYPPNSQLKQFKDSKHFGIKSIFCSNSFAAYRKGALSEIGGFPENIILSEDTYVAAKIIQRGWDIFYAADAMVYHSHNYTVWQEFKRYFDIGVFHCREAWVRDKFGKNEGEGFRFLKSELKYILKSGKWYLAPELAVRNMMKLFGYRMGLMERRVPQPFKAKISMHSNFWST